MGTRGIFGVVIDGIIKATYNHFDSCPEGLGADIVTQVRFMLDSWGIEKMREHARRLVMVSEEVKPTTEQLKELSSFTNLGVGEQSTDDWYCVLRELQGNLTDTLVVCLMIKGGDKFALDSLFCEWGYLVNLDDSTLEVYKGFQNDPHDKGRFAGSGRELKYEGDDSEYYPIALLATFSLANIPDNFAERCEFSALDLFTIGDKEYTDVESAIKEMKGGDFVRGYSIYNDNRDFVTSMTVENGKFAFITP